MKSKAKPVNIKSKPTPTFHNEHLAALAPKLSWFRISVFFKNMEQCRGISMIQAIRLRTLCPMAYFARYTSATESRADYYFTQPPDVALPVIAHTLSRLDKLTFRVSDAFPCEGSVAHSMGLDLAIAIWTKHTAVAKGPEEVKKGFELFADVMHWTANALGIDYCDEAKLHLFAMDRIINIFSNSIALGNKLTAAAKKATKRPGAPERN